MTAFILIMVFLAGVMFGATIMACMAAKRDSDDREEQDFKEWLADHDKRQ